RRTLRRHRALLPEARHHRRPAHGADERVRLLAPRPGRRATRGPAAHRGRDRHGHSHRVPGCGRARPAPESFRRGQCLPPAVRRPDRVAGASPVDFSANGFLIRSYGFLPRTIEERVMRLMESGAMPLAALTPRYDAVIVGARCGGAPTGML